MTRTIQTWLDGRAQTVPADDPRLAAIERHRRLCCLRGITPMERRVYLDALEVREGRAVADDLREVLRADWAARRAAR